MITPSSAGATERECLLLADLSGYTAYLVGGEGDEAPLIAGDLVETVVGQLAPPFALAGLEGDAAFLHAPVSRLDGARLLDDIADCYAAFQRRVLSLRTATSCECSACTTVPQLDLKFFVHVGMVVRQRIAGRDELAGRDVILAHRLMKDSAPAASGSTCYALLTGAAVLALGIDVVAQGLVPVHQRYEHLGDVDGYVMDLRADWERRLRSAVSPVDGPAIADVERLVPARPEVVWEALTSPAGRQMWEGIELVEDLDGAAPRGIGTRTRCVARHLTTIEEIVDWRPHAALARRTEVDGVGALVVAYELRAEGEGTAVRARWHAVSEAAATDASPRLARSLDRLADAVATPAGR